MRDYHGGELTDLYSMTKEIGATISKKRTAEDVAVGGFIGLVFGLIFGIVLVFALTKGRVAHARTHGYADVDMQAAAAYRARTRNLCYQCAADDQNCMDYYCNEQRQLANAAMYGTL